MLIVTGYEASEDKVYKEPLLTDPDEPPPVPVMLAEPAPPVAPSVAPLAPSAAPSVADSVAPVAPECAEHTGGQLDADWLFVG